MSLPPARHPRLLAHAATALVVIDVQESYRQVLPDYERVTAAIGRLVQGAVALDIPVLATEQYPKGLGHTVAEVACHFPRALAPIEKMSLSCCGTPAFREALGRLGRRQILVAGLETHACVNQTVHDLLAGGYQVHVPRDATSSRRADDAAIGWAKMMAAGALPASVESALLELVRTAGTPAFKAIQRIIR